MFNILSKQKPSADDIIQLLDNCNERNIWIFKKKDSKWYDGAGVGFINQLATGKSLLCDVLVKNAERRLNKLHWNWV